MKSFNFKSLKERYQEQLASSITVSIEDLTDNERTLISTSFELFESKLEDIKILQDEVKRLSIELANFKSMRDDTESFYDDDDDDDDF